MGAKCSGPLSWCSGLVVHLPSASAHLGERSDSCWSGRDSRLHKEEAVEEREDEGVEGLKSISSSSMGDGDSGDQTERRGS